MSTLQVANLQGVTDIQLDGQNITATAAEINVLDGITANTTELNLLDGVSGTLVTEAGAQTLTNKTLTAAVLQDGLTIDTETADWSGAVTLDPANGLYQVITLANNVTSITDNLVDGESVILHIDDGSARTIAWPTIIWVSGDGAAPTLQTTANTIITTWKVGTTLYGFASNGA